MHVVLTLGISSLLITVMNDAHNRTLDNYGSCFGIGLFILVLFYLYDGACYGVDYLFAPTEKATLPA